MFGTAILELGQKSQMELATQMYLSLIKRARLEFSEFKVLFDN